MAAKDVASRSSIQPRLPNKERRLAIAVIPQPRQRHLGEIHRVVRAGNVNRRHLAAARSGLARRLRIAAPCPSGSYQDTARVGFSGLSGNPAAAGLKYRLWDMNSMSF